jgi:hypothetical protein
MRVCYGSCQTILTEDLGIRQSRVHFMILETCLLTCLNVRNQ